MTESNPNARLEAFCDGVFAIALTILIIDIKIPANVSIQSTAEFWMVLNHIAPSVFVFLLSFFVILITWVNHHNNLKLVHKSTSAFVYANGLMLLTVVFIPFPTSLMGEFLFTDHASPAVILYTSVLALQAVSWILLCQTAIIGNLGKNDKAVMLLRQNGKYGIYAFVLYSLFAVTAYWFPVSIFLITVLLWIFWLILGINFKHE